MWGVVTRTKRCDHAYCYKQVESKECDSNEVPPLVYKDRRISKYNQKGTMTICGSLVYKMSVSTN